MKQLFLIMTSFAGLTLAVQQLTVELDKDFQAIFKIGKDKKT